MALSSVAGERVRRSNFVYGSGKAGTDSFYLGLGEALREHGVHVSVVRPGFVHSKMTAGRSRPAGGHRRRGRCRRGRRGRPGPRPRVGARGDAPGDVGPAARPAGRLPQAAALSHGRRAWTVTAPGRCRPGGRCPRPGRCCWRCCSSGRRWARATCSATTWSGCPTSPCAPTSGGWARAPARRPLRRRRRGPRRGRRRCVLQNVVLLGALVWSARGCGDRPLLARRPAGGLRALRVEPVRGRAPADRPLARPGRVRRAALAGGARCRPRATRPGAGGASWCCRWPASARAPAWSRRWWWSCSPRAGGPRGRAAWCCWSAANAPWLVAGALHAGSAFTDPLGARVFALADEAVPARWPRSASAASGTARSCPARARGSRPWWPSAGWRPWWPWASPGGGGRAPRPCEWSCAGAAGGPWPCHVAGSGPGEGLGVHVPGAGLVRDGARYLSLCAPCSSLSPPRWARCGRSGSRAPTSPGHRGGAGCGDRRGPVAVMPDAAFGWWPPEPDRLPLLLGGRPLGAAQTERSRPGECSCSRSHLPPAGWNGGRKVLDPLGRYLTPGYVADDRRRRGSADPGRHPRVGRIAVDWTGRTPSRGPGRWPTTASGTSSSTERRPLRTGRRRPRSGAQARGGRRISVIEVPGEVRDRSSPSSWTAVGAAGSPSSASLSCRR